MLENVTPIFICGHPKSGTTLVQSLLDAHPRLLVFPEETEFFTDYFDKRFELSLDDRISYIVNIAYRSFRPEKTEWNSGYRDYSNIDYSRLVETFTRYCKQEPANDAHWLVYIFEAFAKAIRRDTPIAFWVEKTPFNELKFSTILQHFPQAYFIYIFRQPMDVYASYKIHRRKRFSEILNIEEFCSGWQKSCKHIKLCQEMIGPSRCIILNYETLVKETMTLMNSICDTLDLEFDLVLLTPTRNAKPWYGNSTIRQKSEGISITSVNRSLKELTVKEYEFIYRNLNSHYQSLFNLQTSRRENGR